MPPQPEEARWDANAQPRDSPEGRLAEQDAASQRRLQHDALARRTFRALDQIRVYTKQPGKPADKAAPFTLDRGATVGDLAERIQKDVRAAMKLARIWGPSTFDGQSVHADHPLAEGDVVEIHI
jgi:ribosome-interacting GTPase 1